MVGGVHHMMHAVVTVAVVVAVVMVVTVVVVGVDHLGDLSTAVHMICLALVYARVIGEITKLIFFIIQL